MAKQRATLPSYTVSIYDDPVVVGALRFTFVPKTSRGAQAKVKSAQPVLEYIMTAQWQGAEMKFNWIKPPALQSAREELEEIAKRRLIARRDWIEKLSKLVRTVKEWAEDLDWSTRTVEKKMEDAEIGNYSAPGLLIQQETVRLFLEPVARTAPGTEGLVDLYLMPSYDDIASLYYYNNRWNVHYMFEGAPDVGDILEAEAQPLTKATIRKVFDEMKEHAE